MKVEIELEDLETLLYGSVAIKGIEQALDIAKRDPLAPSIGKFTRAHNDLVAAMNSVHRAAAGTAIDWNGVLTDKEIKRLKQYGDYPVEVTPNYRRDHSEIDSLLAKGCIRMGQCVVGCIWPGEPRADIKPSHAFAVVITARGKEKLEEALHSLKLKAIRLDENKS